jgi:hypothetical protein
MFKSFCHDQVKLLLERMESNPEEFLHHSRWNPFLPDMHHVVKGTADYFRAFNVIERTLIAHKFNKLCNEAMRRNAYNRILEVAIAGEEKTVKDKWVSTATTSSINLNANTVTGMSVIKLGDTTLTEKDLKKMKKKTIWSILL